MPLVGGGGYFNCLMISCLSKLCVSIISKPLDRFSYTQISGDVKPIATWCGKRDDGWNQMFFIKVQMKCFFLLPNLKEQQKSGRSPFTVS